MTLSQKIPRPPNDCSIFCDSCNVFWDIQVGVRPRNILYSIILQMELDKKRSHMGTMTFWCPLLATALTLYFFMALPRLAGYSTFNHRIFLNNSRHNKIAVGISFSKRNIESFLFDKTKALLNILVIKKSSQCMLSARVKHERRNF